MAVRLVSSSLIWKPQPRAITFCESLIDDHVHPTFETMDRRRKKRLVVDPLELSHLSTTLSAWHILMIFPKTPIADLEILLSSKLLNSLVAQMQGSPAKDVQ